MLTLDAVVVILVVGALVYGTVTLLARARDQGAPGRGPVEWRVNHRDVHGETRVVLQKVSPGGISILAEHVVAAIPVDDPAYDEKFLTAMNAARERRALFESEEE
ncbi:MAG: hypothetical protein QOK15_825 [Nocardioidaceae bacterium]|jgi:hypothetical protein|nr:hypothetical protein [Nocardioidaceae bacterium]